MAAKKKVVPGTASGKLPRGIAVYNGRYYSTSTSAGLETVEETVVVRAKALKFKASLKDVAPKLVLLPPSLRPVI